MATKAFLNSLEKGQILQAGVEDIISNTEVLCNFHGELLLIANHTGIKFKKGSSVRLQVKSVDPLRFQIVNTRSTKFERVI